MAAPRERDAQRDPDCPRLIEVVKRAIKKVLPPKLAAPLDDTMSVPKP